MAYALPSLDGRTALVTGANSGVGLAAATALAAAGARVLMACRNQAKAEAAAAQVRATATGPVEIVPLDLASLASVAACAEEVGRRIDRLDLLLNNAGLMNVDEGRTEDGFEVHIGVNHLGHFALTARLLPLLHETPAARVVTMTSIAHRLGGIRVDDLHFERRRYTRWGAYIQSKLANALFALELHRRLERAGAGTTSLAAHPGLTRTNLGQEGSGLSNRLTAPAMLLTPPARHGAQPLLRAATDPDARSGELYGPALMAMGAPRIERPHRRARDPETARRLWERSEELTGLTVPVAPA